MRLRDWRKIHRPEPRFVATAETLSAIYAETLIAHRKLDLIIQSAKPHMSPEDQKKLNEIYALAASMKSKIDDAEA